MAAIIATHRTTKDAKEPSRVATPMSIPVICRIATTQDMAASPIVAASAVAVSAVLLRVTVCNSILRARTRSLRAFVACMRPSLFRVLVMAAPPDARLIAPLGGAVEPMAHGQEGVQPACIGGVGVVDDASLEHERAHAR